MLDKFKTEKDEHAYIEDAIIGNVIIPVLNKYGIDFESILKK